MRLHSVEGCMRSFLLVSLGPLLLLPLGACG
jgi:hypothetical protein